MANVCSRCSTDNADGVAVCRQCGASLSAPAGWSRSLIPDDDNFDPLSAPTLVMQHTAPGVLPPLSEILIPPEPEPSRFGPKLLLGIVAFAGLLAGGVWLMRPSGEATAPAPAAQPVVAAPSQPAVAASEVAPAPASAAASDITLVSPVSPGPAASAVVSPAPPVVAQAASVPDRRKRIPEPVMRRPSQPAVEPAPAVETAPVVAAPPPPAPVPEPAKPKTVTELCSAGNLLTRGFCEHRECGKPEHAGDAVCVRLKEAEEARRFRQ